MSVRLETGSSIPKKQKETVVGGIVLLGDPDISIKGVVIEVFKAIFSPEKPEKEKSQPTQTK